MRVTIQRPPLMLIRGALSHLLGTQITAEMQRRMPAMACLEVTDVGHAAMLKVKAVIAAMVEFFKQ